MTTIWIDPPELKATSTMISNNLHPMDTVQQPIDIGIAGLLPPSIAGWVTEEVAAINEASRQSAVDYLVQGITVFIIGELIEQDQSLITQPADGLTVAPSQVNQSSTEPVGFSMGHRDSYYPPGVSVDNYYPPGITTPSSTTSSFDPVGQAQAAQQMGKIMQQQSDMANNVFAPSGAVYNEGKLKTFGGDDYIGSNTEYYNKKEGRS